MDIKDMREQRGKAVHDARQILDKAKEEKREFTEDEQKQWDSYMDEADDLRQKIEREERLVEAERESASQAAPENSREHENQAEFRESFNKALAYGIHTLNPDEMRALQATNDQSGGYLQPDEQFVNQLIKAVDDMVFIRQRATVFTVTEAEKMGAPSLENDPADADWTTELGIGSEDSTMDFGKRQLEPHPLAKLLKVSEKLLRAVPSAEGLVRDRLAYKFGITDEKAFLTGSGASQPLGVFTASDQGISTSRDVSTGNTSTSIQFDGLMEAKYSLKGQYWSRADWMFHRDGVKQIAKLKDGEGQYIWRESVRSGEPDMLLGRPVVMSEYVPNTFTSTNYVGILGDFSNYWIVDALTFRLQRLVELYAGNGQIGFIGRKETDGAPVLEEAFARVKLA